MARRRQRANDVPPDGSRATPARTGCSACASTAEAADRPHGGEPAARAANVALDCGWGRLLFAQTFDEPADAGRRRCARKRPSGATSPSMCAIRMCCCRRAPQELFLDPSHTYRLDLSTYRAVAPARRSGFIVRRLTSRADAEAVNRIYAARGMVPVPPDFFWSQARQPRRSPISSPRTRRPATILGTVTGVDHAPRLRRSRARLVAVVPRGRSAGAPARHRRGAGAPPGRAFRGARRGLPRPVGAARQRAGDRALREARLPSACRSSPSSARTRSTRRCSPARETDDGLNPYATIIVDEARRRGIHVEVTDAEGGFFRLTYGGRSIHCRESLSELTIGRRDVDLRRQGGDAPRRRARRRRACPSRSRPATRRAAIAAFLDAPRQRRGQAGARRAGPRRRGRPDDDGRGRRRRSTRRASVCDRVLVESASRARTCASSSSTTGWWPPRCASPPRVVGDGQRTIARADRGQSRRRAAATGGESTIPIDAETERCLRRGGL